MRERVKAQTETSPYELSIRKARRILDDISRIPETAIFKPDREVIGTPRIFTDAMPAIHVVSNELVKGQPENFISKDRNDESMYAGVISANDGTFLDMQYVKSDNETPFRPLRRVQLIFPLDEKARDYAPSYPNAGFKNGDIVGHYNDNQSHLWKGIRWASANLLNWDKGIILPEQVDTFYPAKR